MTNEPGRELGMIVAEPTRAVLTLAAKHGVKTIILDAEQTGLSAASCTDIVSMFRGSGTAIGIRVPELGYDSILSYANTGAQELVLPRIKSVEELEQAYRFTRYPPGGERPRQVSAASQYGTDYAMEPTLSVLFETVEAIDDLDSFLQCPRFTGGWVGTTDLKADLDRRGMGDSLALYVDKVVQEVSRAGLPIGLPAAGPQGVQEAFAAGATRAALYWEKYVLKMFEALNASGHD